MKIYIMRHGETDWNLAKKAQGQTDIELNEAGINQALEAKETIKKFNIDLIISSPLKRAKKTAELVSNSNIEILFDKRLQERCFGDLEGSNTDTMDWENIYNCEKNISSNNIEPVSDFLNRVNDFLKEIKIKYPNKRLLIVTHGGTLRAVNACINGIPATKTLAGQGYHNCEIREFDI